MANILVVDDDENILEVIRARLEANGYQVETCSDPLEALAVVREQECDLVVSDVRMPQIDGIEFLRRVRQLRHRVPVILLTAYGTIPSAVEAIKEGAFDYLTKPFQGKELLKTVERALGEAAKSLAGARGGPDQKHFPGVYGISQRMRDLYPLLERICATDSTVLIQGESGTGKELIAQMIHSNSSRAAERFVVLDCGAMPGSLIESELFGHAKGAFTHAAETRKGLFELADRGTLFIDEIGSLPMDLQPRLLRALQEGQIRRIGENQMRSVSVRVVAATNVDLQERVKKGLFRLDLYYRLAVLKVELPPLRERKEDIPLLAEYFLQNFSKKMKREPMRFEQGVVESLCSYGWPGNIRELKNVIEAGVVLSRGPVLTAQDLRMAGFPGGPADAAHGRRPGHEIELPGSLPAYLESLERRMILKALEDNNWVQKDAAEKLGISPRVLCYKIKKLEINIPRLQREGILNEAPDEDEGEEGPAMLFKDKVGSD
jgi:DNA-binding NtrC family response regulator